MNKDTLREAVVAAERFIKAANQVKWARKTIPASDSYPKLDYLELTHKEAAAAQRASLDLTRALAKMRRPS